MKIVISAAAEREISEATAYYDDQFPGLGEQLFSEYLAAVERIRMFPNAWPRTSDRARQCKLRRFPYAIIYRVQPALITVVAFAHQHRQPGYWQSRLS